MSRGGEVGNRTCERRLVPGRYRTRRFSARIVHGVPAETRALGFAERTLKRASASALELAIAQHATRADARASRRSGRRHDASSPRHTRGHTRGSVPRDLEARATALDLRAGCASAPHDGAARYVRRARRTTPRRDVPRGSRSRSRALGAEPALAPCAFTPRIASGECTVRAGVRVRAARASDEMRRTRAPDEDAARAGVRATKRGKRMHATKHGTNAPARYAPRERSTPRDPA